MSAFSTSFTLGKASSPNGANVEHNNREFIADNVDVNRIADNITYVKQDVRQAYEELFGKYLAEYNERQKQPCRRIDDYYEHILNGRREEAFYEIIVQFGDSHSAPVGSENGELAKKLLDEYIRGFNERNKNLHIFNACTHMDEQSPHLHINVIPFYTEGRQKGLSKGVSMRAALDEQGFTARNGKQNRLVAWEESEMKEMEKILNRHGLRRDVKNVTHAHQSVGDYKESQDEKKITAVRMWSSSAENTAEQLRQENKILRLEKEKLNEQRHSPWKSFFYSVPEKQSFVQAKLDEMKIPYRETENGIEAQECYVEQIRKLEKDFKPDKNPLRDSLRDNLDKIIMQSKTYGEVLERLKRFDYSVKEGKYVSVTPKHSSKPIRLKSLGEEYSEQGIKNRFVMKQMYERNIDSKLSTAKNSDALEVMILKTIKQYTIVFVQGVLPVRKRDKKKPFSWENDAELDYLAGLNKRINAGETLTSLRNEFARLDKSVAEKETQIATFKKELVLFIDLYAKGERCFKFYGEDEKDLAHLAEHKVTAENYQRIAGLITTNEFEIAELEATLPGECRKLKETSDTLTAFEKIAGGTFVQNLANAEKQRTQAAYIKNGIKRAD
jgi:hypothetical protein